MKFAGSAAADVAAELKCVASRQHSIDDSVTLKCRSHSTHHITHTHAHTYTEAQTLGSTQNRIVKVRMNDKTNTKKTRKIKATTESFSLHYTSIVRQRAAVHAGSTAYCLFAWLTSWLVS